MLFRSQFSHSECFLGAVCRECDLKLRTKEIDLLHKEAKCPDTLTEEDLDWLDSWKQKVEPNELSNEECEDFNQTNKCSSCEQSLKVRDHDHLTGLYRVPACNSCNLKLKYKPHIPIIFHNFTGYDSHFIIPELTKFIKQNQYMKDDEPKEYTPKVLASNFEKI